MIDSRLYTTSGFHDYPLEYRWVRLPEQSDKLAVILPGADYSVDNPILYYAASQYLQQSYDVLQINYKYDNKPKIDTSDDLMQAIEYASNKVLDEVCQIKTYKTFHIIGKSIGTIACKSLMNKKEMAKAKFVWITPLIKNKDVYHSMKNCQQESYCIMGDKDPNYKKIHLDKIMDNPNMLARIIPEANHALELPDNPAGSIDITKEFILDLKQFITAEMASKTVNTV